MCLEHRLPKRTDLLILEHYPLLEGASPLDLERLLHNLRLFFGGRLPPILFLNLMRAANAMPHDPTAECISGPMSKCAPGQPCVAAFADRPWQGDIDHFRHNETQTVARHYGLSSLSHIHVVAHLARKLEQQGINRCQLLCSLNMDPLHPREMGRILLADLLTDHVQRAVKWLQATTPPAVRPRWGRWGGTGGKRWSEERGGSGGAPFEGSEGGARREGKGGKGGKGSKGGKGGKRGKGGKGGQRREGREGGKGREG